MYYFSKRGCFLQTRHKKTMNRIMIELDGSGFITDIFVLASDDRAAQVCVGRLTQLVGNRTWGWLRRIIKRKR